MTDQERRTRDKLEKAQRELVAAETNTNNWAKAFKEEREKRVLAEAKLDESRLNFNTLCASLAKGVTT